MSYAKGTVVAVDKSLAEIKALLTKNGATSFAYFEDNAGAVVAFSAHGRQIRFSLPLPDRNAREFTHSSKGARTHDLAAKVWEQACRERWRNMLLMVKAKFAAIDCKITTFEDEFLAHTIMPNKQTVGQWMAPQLEQAYLTNTMPATLMIEGPRSPQ